MYAYNGSLCIYYACALGLQMKERKIVKWLEPILHLIPFVLGLFSATFPLALGLYAPPTVGTASWCTFSSSRSLATFRLQRSIQTYLILTLVTAMVLSFAIIIRRVLKIEREMSSFERFGGSYVQERAQETQKNSKVVLIQAIGYVSAFLITLVIPLLRNAFNSPILVGFNFCDCSDTGLF